MLNHFKMVKQVTWHAKGDYFATVMPDGQNRSVLINQLSKRRSQLPFNKSKGLIQCVLFHPIRPFLFVAVRKYKFVLLSLHCKKISFKINEWYWKLFKMKFNMLISIKTIFQFS